VKALGAVLGVFRGLRERRVVPTNHGQLPGSNFGKSDPGSE
jgi:hypothetical protein